MKPLWWMQGPLFEEAGADGAGAGGGSGAGAGAGGAGTPGFDAAAFETKMLAAIDGKLNGFSKSMKGDITKLLARNAGEGSGAGAGAGEGSGSGSGAGAGDGAGGEGLKNVDPALAAEIRALRRKNEELSTQFTQIKNENQQTKAEAEKTDLQANLRTKLAKFKLADDNAQNDAFEIFAPKVKRDEEGRIVGHDGTPIDQYLDEQLKTRQYLFAPKDVGGAGARGGNRGTGGTRTFSLEDIDNIKSLSAEDQAKLRAQIGLQMGAAQSGR